MQHAGNQRLIRHGFFECLDLDVAQNRPLLRDERGQKEYRRAAATGLGAGMNRRAIVIAPVSGAGCGSPRIEQCPLISRPLNTGAHWAKMPSLKPVVGRAATLRRLTRAFHGPLGLNQEQGR